MKNIFDQALRGVQIPQNDLITIFKSGVDNYTNQQRILAQQ